MIVFMVEVGQLQGVVEQDERKGMRKKMKMAEAATEATKTGTEIITPFGGGAIFFLLRESVIVDSIFVMEIKGISSNPI